MGAAEVNDRQQVLSFRIGGALFAVRLPLVREIVPYEAPTVVPSAPPFIRGVINLRGSVIPIVDLASRLGLPVSLITKRSCLLIIEADLGGERAVLGALVDEVREVLELAPSDIETPPSLGLPVSPELLGGLVRLEGRFVHLLDLPGVLAADHGPDARVDAPTAATAATR
jgi:purine-binding chemotaxis protein CheW